MTRTSILIFAAGAVIVSTLHAHAASSDWFETEGGRVRIVTSGLPDADGRLQGALEIDLRPGWKTYWRDPGDAGVPPTIDISRSTNLTSAEFAFPAPSRHDEGDFTWAGYDRPVTLPIHFQAAQGGASVVVKGDVFLGICETICIPVKAELQVDPASDPDNEDDKAVVEAARAALPVPARPDFGATVASRNGNKLVVRAMVPGDSAGADIFIAGNDDYVFGTPQRSDEGGAVIFTVEIDGPDTAPTGTALNYTLVSKVGAVSGTLTGF